MACLSFLRASLFAIKTRRVHSVNEQQWLQTVISSMIYLELERTPESMNKTYLKESKCNDLEIIKADFEL